MNNPNSKTFKVIDKHSCILGEVVSTRRDDALKLAVARFGSDVERLQGDNLTPSLKSLGMHR